MPDALELTLAGEPMLALADRALYWPARARLLIADLHLGKGNVLRSAGIPVPSGGTRHDLARLDRLLDLTAARELWILGDFLHGPRHPDVEAGWRALLATHPRVAARVVAGNHDRALQAAALDLGLLPDDVSDGPFRFRHQPLAAADPGGAHVVCGHVHPVVRVPGLLGRYPAFQLAPTQTILPAFSAFTGGWRIDTAPGRADPGWIACADGELVARR